MSTTIESLDLKITSESQSAAGGLDRLIGTLDRLKNATKGGIGLTAVANQVSKVGAAAKGVDSTSISNLNGLAKAIQNMSNLGGVKLSSTIAKNINEISLATKNLNGVSFAPITDLVEGLRPLSEMPKQNISFTLTQLKKLPDVLDGLEKMDMGAFTAKIQEVTNVLRPLADEMAKISVGFSAFPAKLQKVTNASNRLSKSTANSALSFGVMYTKALTAYMAVKQGGEIIASLISGMNDYIENVNLFTASMGEYADKAKLYAENVGELMGIDPGEWMRNQGVFMTLATGFGVAGDRAYKMSQQLTQLGYDISSFFNISYEEAMQKLQSGLSGELEPLRRLGYDLSQARLEAIALSLGIDKAVSSMTQAEKAQLRYYAIMTQVTTAQRDMARTLNAPANQLRIFRAQATQAARALGSIFIPALNTILPYAIAVTKVIRTLAETIANLLGFTMPEVDYSGISTIVGGTADLTEGFDNASEAAKKLQKYTMGFDELNVIDTSSAASGGGAVAGAGGAGGFDFELPEYDFLDGMVSNRVDAIMQKLEPMITWLKSNLDNIFDVVTSIGTGLLIWKFSDGFKSIISDIQDNGINKVAMGIVIGVTGFTFEWKGAYEIGYEGATIGNVLKTAIGAALGIGGSLLVFGTGPVGWTIGIATAVTLLVTGITFGAFEKAKENDLADRFGEYVLSDMELSDLVSKLTTTDLSLAVDMYIDETQAVTEAKVQVESAIKTLNSYNFKIQCGLDVSRSDYMAAVDGLLSSAQEYITSKQITAAMAIDITYDGTETGERLSAFTSSFYTESQGKLTELGNRLKDVVATGFEDGKWIEDKLSEAIKLQTEIQEVMDYMSNVEFEAKLSALKLDATDTDITSDSFQALLKEAQATIEGQLNDLEAVRLEAIKVAQMEYDQAILNGESAKAAKELYDAAVAAADEKFRAGKLELTYGTYEFGIDVIQSKYAAEISQTIPLMQQSTQELFVKGTASVFPEETYDNVDLLISQLRDAYTFGFNELDISSAARANMAELVKELQPTEMQFKTIAEEALKAGQSVPDNVSKGLTDINMLKAMSGDMVAINYMLGQHLSTDTSFLDMLQTCENAGVQIGQHTATGITNNLQVVEDAANGTITLINDTIGSRVYEVTPTLVQNLKDLGVNISDGLLQGVEEENSANESFFKKIWGKLAFWARDEFDSHSPSRVFSAIGSDVAAGLFGGVDSNISEDDYRTIWGRIHSSADTVFGSMKTSVTGIWDGMWTSIKGTINSIIGGIETMANGVVDGINRMINALNRLDFDIPSWVPGLGGRSFGLNLRTIDHITIPRLYAEGGFPTTGQMFIAREAGAEMVGTIGRRTAVVNNDQIVEGIAGGVAEANSEQNALLKEQNALLRALLEKESGVYLDGKRITNSVENYQRSRGRTIVMGGV